jgi:surface antigen
MLTRMRTVGSVVLLAALLTGCADAGWKTAVGGLGGAAAGGLIGAAAGGGGAGIAAGAILGGLLGGAAGNLLDQRDKRIAAEAQQRALESVPSGQSTTWRNPDSGHSGVITPVRTYQTATGQYCREYTQTITVGGKKQEAFGKACREPDGSWKIVS